MQEAGESLEIGEREEVQQTRVKIFHSINFQNQRQTQNFECALEQFWRNIEELASSQTPYLFLGAVAQATGFLLLLGISSYFAVYYFVLVVTEPTPEKNGASATPLSRRNRIRPGGGVGKAFDICLPCVKQPAAEVPSWGDDDEGLEHGDVLQGRGPGGGETASRLAA